MYADLALQQLQCNRQSDGSGGCNPYLWVVLLQIDTDTLGSGTPVAAVYPVDPSAARLVVKAGMKAGDTAITPDEVAYLGVHFRSDAPERDLILIAALLDQHDTSWSAMAAGYAAFLEAAPTEVGKHLLELQDPALKEQAINEITDKINQQVSNAIESKLSWWDKLQIAAHVQTPDRVIASVHQDWEGVAPASAGSFSLDFPSGSAPNLTDDFVLSCRLLVSDDPCEAQAAAVKEFQEAIANIEGRAKQLNSGHGGEPPAQVQAELDQLASEMLKERAKLEDAEIALEKCRKWNVTPVGTGGPVKADPKA